ncbi:DUF6082 family protein [Streptomyces flaveus]|uniref:Uncharacterized protein n=1 Tax=Streptomyces flaveus TaxID=66370 RepID=A0A917VTU0_9ACTN|nr:DUF6082 family protein [Streptomyces flaveus]GGL13528.1 hypothetical protein GCM10010094_88000 [Streptomyces flaveus]
MAVLQQDELVRELIQRVGLMTEGIARVAEEMHRANLIQLHRFFVEQLDQGIADPSLADALSTLNGLSEGKRRQMLFANREYGLLLLGYRIGALDRGELLGTLKVLSKNSVFAEYWELTAEQREMLPAESLEARAGRAIDVIMDERGDELDEWWVVVPESPDA